MECFSKELLPYCIEIAQIGIGYNFFLAVYFYWYPIVLMLDLFHLVLLFCPFYLFIRLLLLCILSTL